MFLSAVLKKVARGWGNQSFWKRVKTQKVLKIGQKKNKMSLIRPSKRYYGHPQLELIKLPQN